MKTTVGKTSCWLGAGGMMRQVGSPKFRCFSFCTSNGKEGLSKHPTRKYNSASAFSVSSYFLKSPTRCYPQIHKTSKMSPRQLSMSLTLSSKWFWEPVGGIMWSIQIVQSTESHFARQTMPYNGSQFISLHCQNQLTHMYLLEVLQIYHAQGNLLVSWWTTLLGLGNDCAHGLMKSLTNEMLVGNGSGSKQQSY